jgi:hypothetical protein
MYRIRVNTYVSHGNKSGITEFVPGKSYEVSDKDFKILERSKVVSESTKLKTGGGNHDHVDGAKNNAPGQGE